MMAFIQFTKIFYFICHSENVTLFFLLIRSFFKQCQKKNYFQLCGEDEIRFLIRQHLTIIHILMKVIGTVCEKNYVEKPKQKQ